MGHAGSRRATLRARVHALYYGQSPAARRFGYVQIAFDVAIISFFVVLSFIDAGSWIVPIDLTLAALLAADLFLRVWSSASPWRSGCRLSSLADLIVIVSLLMPSVTESYAFLRVLRTVRLMRSYHMLGLLRARSRWVRRNEEILLAITNLVVFMFFVSATVYVTQARRNPEIDNYVDALYFTVTTLTTTGFGDITLHGSGGRLLSVLIMVFGIGLFVRLAQALFRPRKVHYTCPVCGLNRHDPDAVHCKHCGATVNIPTEGEA